MLRGFGEWLEEDARGRFCILNRRNYTRNGHDWNPMPDMELESLRGGSYFWKRGSPRGGGERGSDEPPEPPWLRACCTIITYPSGIGLFLMTHHIKSLGTLS